MKDKIFILIGFFILIVFLCVGVIKIFTPISFEEQNKIVEQKII